MPDLTTTYLGLKLRNPLVVSSCPLTGHLEKLLRLEAAGAAAVVLPSLFAEQIEANVAQPGSAHGGADFLSPLPRLDDYNAGPDGYLAFAEHVKKSLSIPVIASLNGVEQTDWVRFARLLQDAGVDALELNLYILAADPSRTSAEIEARYVELTAAVRRDISIPLAVKIGPYFTSPGNMAARLIEAGADGLVLFNRYFQPEINVYTLAVEPYLDLSSPAELRLPLRWLAILRERLAASLAASTGVDTAEDVVKYLLAGADVVMTASSLLRHGPDHLCTLLQGLENYLVQRGWGAVAQMRGVLSQHRAMNHAAYERANYTRALLAHLPCERQP